MDRFDHVVGKRVGSLVATRSNIPSKQFRNTLALLKRVLVSSLAFFACSSALTGTTIYAQVYFAEGRIELVTKRAADDLGKTNTYAFYVEVVGGKYKIRLRTGVMLLSTGLAKARSTIGAALCVRKDANVERLVNAAAASAHLCGSFCRQLPHE
ncbi:MAG: hypothetical protein RMN51_09095 [Verrucomicrobiota bacterium]|nr:hypothetical protein [Limisphaera sp.]MDW8382246.1 hypothetical protein [Verrucomicrobiota bacterium]